LKKKTLEEKVKLLKEKTFYQEMQVKEVQTNDDESLSVSGYFNRFRLDSGAIVKDGDGDSVLPNSMNLERYRINPIVLAQHRHGDPIGTCTNIELREDGVWGTAKIYKALNETMYNAVKLGVVKTFSIGFTVGDVTYNADLDIWFLKETSLLELSLVSIPSNQYSYVESVTVGNNYQLSLSSSKAEKLLEEFQEVPQESQDLLKEVRDTLEVLKTFIENSNLKEVITVDEIVTTEEVQEASESLEVLEGTDKDLEGSEVVKENTEVADGDKGDEVVIPTITELADSMVVTEETFNTLLGVTESLQAKLNSFLNENLN